MSTEQTAQEQLRKILRQMIASVIVATAIGSLFALILPPMIVQMLITGSLFLTTATNVCIFILTYELSDFGAEAYDRFA